MDPTYMFHAIHLTNFAYTPWYLPAHKALLHFLRDVMSLAAFVDDAQLFHPRCVWSYSCFAMLLWPTYVSLSFRVSCYCVGKNPVVFHSKYIANQSSFFLLIYSIMSMKLFNSFNILCVTMQS